MDKSWLRRYGGIKNPGWILPWDVICTTGTLYSLERILMEWKQSLCKFGEARVPCLWSMKIELWDAPALQKAKAPFTSQLLWPSVPSTQCMLLFSKPSVKAPPSLVAAPLNSFENLTPGLSATNAPVELVSNAPSGTEWLGVSLYCEKPRTEWNTLIRYSQGIWTCCQLQDTKTLRQPL